MSAPLKDRIAGTLAEVRTRALLTLKLEVRPLIVIGETPTTFRRVGVVYGGRFEGERLSGEVLDGGQRLAVGPSRWQHPARRPAEPED